MVQPTALKQAQAVSEEMRKMALERRILPDIKSIFAQMIADYVASLIETGSIPPAMDFQGEWAAAFVRHYRRVGRLFLNNQRRSKFYECLVSRKQALEEEQNQALIATFGRWLRGFGSQQSALITQTNQRDYLFAFRAANDVVPGADRSVLAASAGVILRRLFRARETTIANVQTQAPAEEAKKQEADALARSDGKREDETTKTWQTVGDTSVRISHVAAQGQFRPGNAAFSVGGEALKYPGDSSLGASVGNVANCRCAAIWS